MTSGEVGGGWGELDNNPATVQIVAAGGSSISATATDGSGATPARLSRDGKNSITIRRQSTSSRSKATFISAIPTDVYSASRGHSAIC